MFVFQASGPGRLYSEMSAEVIFMNPANETLKDCTLTVSGSGLFVGETTYK